MRETIRIRLHHDRDLLLSIMEKQQGTHCILSCDDISECRMAIATLLLSNKQTLLGHSKTVFSICMHVQHFIKISFKIVSLNKV
jgi:hypothetical protein